MKLESYERIFREKFSVGGTQLLFIEKRGIHVDNKYGRQFVDQKDSEQRAFSFGGGVPVVDSKIGDIVSIVNLVHEKSDTESEILLSLNHRTGHVVANKGAINSLHYLPISGFAKFFALIKSLFWYDGGQYNRVVNWLR